MKITQEGTRIRIQLSEMLNKKWVSLADFRINQEDYPEFRKHIIRSLNEFNPTLDDIKHIKI